MSKKFQKKVHGPCGAESRLLSKLPHSKGVIQQRKQCNFKIKILSANKEEF
jgi:hypothetical protein